MITERSEALSMFRKWLEEDAVLRCMTSLRSIAVVAGDLKIVEAPDDGRVLARTRDGKTDILLSLERAVAFVFGDSLSVPDTTESFDSGLAIFFEDFKVTPDPEGITFIEPHRSS